MAKKASKKYALSRRDIAEKLDELYGRLTNIDTFTTSPDEVANEVSTLADEVSELSSEVSEEA